VAAAEGGDLKRLYEGERSGGVAWDPGRRSGYGASIHCLREMRVVYNECEESV
jgi:hypothetical protein